jgi:glycosyltransferase involved in cell wall biosynthesis
MSIFNVPKWLKSHLYDGKDFNELSAESINELQLKFKRFAAEKNPEVSVVIPAWNEAKNIHRSLSSLAATNSRRRIEIIVINNNSTDDTQKVLDEIGVKSFFEKSQGIAYARQLGLLKAKGKYHLCADSDTLYPPSWIDQMIKPMELSANEQIVGVYGRYSFLPIGTQGRFLFTIYETITSLLIRVRKAKKEHINVLGFNMGFVAAIGRETGGFNVTSARTFDNALGSETFTLESEDGRMALNLKTRGKLKLVTHPSARVFTSSRRLEAEGGLLASFVNRFKIHTKNFKEYIS